MILTTVANEAWAEVADLFEANHSPDPVNRLSGSFVPDLNKLFAVLHHV
jgi:hypothetical protein